VERGRKWLELGLGIGDFLGLVSAWDDVIGQSFPAPDDGEGAILYLHIVLYDNSISTKSNDVIMSFDNR
jgi:hypothetical protein